MPFFDEDPLDGLTPQADAVDRELDLRGLDAADALARVHRLLDDAVDGERVLVLFDGASGDGRETLFLPVGRALLSARRAGRLQRCLPVRAGSGYFLQIAAGD